MKKVKLIPVLLLIHIGLMAQNLRKVETYYDPFARTRIHEAYTTLPTPPYAVHGLYQEWDEYGTLNKEETYSNGKKNGASKIFIGTGYAVLGGHKELLGKVIYVTNYSNDVLNGLEQKFDYPNGRQQMVLQKTWVNGEQVKEEQWNTEGVKTKQFQMNGPCFELFPDGKKASEYATKNGEFDGKYTSWYNNGQIEISTTYANGAENGKHVQYYENGKTALEAVYVNGKVSGTMTVYFEDGKTLKTIKYDPTTFKGTEEKVYAVNGKLKFERVVVSGDKCKSISYDTTSGNKLVEQEDSYDATSDKYLRNGHYLKYFVGGKTNIDCYYTNDIPNGAYREYDTDGNIIKSGEAKMDALVGEWLYTYNDKWEETKSKKEASYFRKINFGSGNGPWKTTDYYITGEKQFEGSLASVSPDVPTGDARYYRKNGSLSEEHLAQPDGSTKITLYHENGKPKIEEQVVSNQLSGKFKQYDVNGQVLAEGQFSKGQKTGEWKMLLDSARKAVTDKSSATYSRTINYNSTGAAPWQVTDADMEGNKVFEGSLTKEFPDVSTGQSKYYNKLGNVVHKIDYASSVEYKYFYTKEGKLVKEGRTDGPQVVWTEYTLTGTKTSYTPITDPSWQEDSREPVDGKKNMKEKLKSFKKLLN